MSQDGNDGRAGTATGAASDPATWIGQEVLLDLSSRFVVAGRLTALDERFLTLEDADVHDLRDSSTTRDVYTHETRRYGIRANRRRVLIPRGEVVALSLLADVLE